MTPEAQKLLEEVRKLSPADRALLVDELLLGPNDDDPTEVEASWAEESQRRAEEIDSGRATLLSRDEFREQLRKARQPSCE